MQLDSKDHLLFLPYLKEYSQEYTNYPKEIIEFSLDKDTIHPTQKPVKLMRRLIEKFTKEGDLIIDPGYDGVFGKVKIWPSLAKEVKDNQGGIDQGVLF